MKRWARNLLASCLALACPGFAASLAGAQTEGVPGSDGGTSATFTPQPLEVGVDYPAGGEGAAIVTLQFVVGTDGAVREIEVVLGDEPFASAAIAATAKWRFAPARRDGRVVAARIQFEVRFSQEIKPAASSTPAPAPDPAGGEARRPSRVPPAPVGSAEAAQQHAVEVTVEAKLPPGTVSYSRAEARAIPGSLGDPFRAIDSMPGVSPAIISPLPVYYIRGSPPGNIGYYLDGVRIPFLYHAVAVTSVIHPELIERVNLYPGPYPIEHGRIAGAVVSADLRSPRRELGGQADIGLFNAGGFVEAPFAGDRGNLFVGGRYSYSALLATALTDLTLDFWNYQAYAEYDLSRRDTVGVLALGAFDHLERDGFWEVEFHRVDLRYDRRFTADTSARLGVTLGTESTAKGDGTVGDDSIAGRLELRHRLDDRLLWRVGGSASLDSYSLQLDNAARNYQDLLDLFRAENDVALGAYTDLTWEPMPWISVTPGARFDAFKSGTQSELGVDPRVTARFELSRDVATVHGVGLAHQPPDYIPNIVPGARVVGLSGGLQQAVHTNSGVELKLPSEVKGVVSVFQNAIFSATDPFSSRDFEVKSVVARRRSLARTYGLELSLRRALTRRFGALFNYTLSRSTRTYSNYTTLSGSDRTHVVNLGVLYTLGPAWRLGARGLLYSGIPGSREFAQATRDGKQLIFDQDRAAPFVRLDLRLERRFRLGEDSYISVAAEAQNVTFSQDVLTRTCTVQNGSMTCDEKSVLAIPLPSLRLEARL